ncbi:hypothetical protein NEPAR06_1245 [Nematocida parisii]|nr:hypothetical protein NEPAR06_1245 [Nematocida parisii]KAI5158560.1 hypothetical protein NEPAR05_2093 [Nematocida parisii]
MRYKTKALITLSIIVQLINSTTDQINLEGRKHKRKREEQLNTPQKCSKLC